MPTVSESQLKMCMVLVKAVRQLDQLKPQVRDVTDNTVPVKSVGTPSISTMFFICIIY